MKNKIAGIVAVICTLMNVYAADAAPHEINYIKSLNGDYVTVSGTVANGSGSEVFIRVEYAGEALSTDTDSLENSVIYQKQTTADENGSFKFDIKLKDTDDDTYTLSLGVLGDDEDISETFVFYGEGYRNTALGAIQTAQNNKDSNALANAIITYYPNLYLQTPLFNAYIGSDDDLSEIKSLLVNYPAITTIEMLEEALEGAVILKDLKDCTDYEDMQDVFGVYESELEILSSTIYELTYSKLSEKLKKDVYNTFINGKYYTPDEITDAFTLSVLNTYLANAVGAQSVKNVLTDNAEMLDIDMTDYSLSDDKYMKLIGVEFVSIPDVKAKLDNLQNQATVIIPGGGQGSGGSGGSGGGGGFSSSSVVPSVGQNTTTGNLSTETYPFDDMEDYVWAKEATLALYKSGVLHGVGDNSFAPDRVITREEFLKLIINGFEISADTDSDVSFADVSKEQWYYPFVKTGVNSGVVNGMDNNSFGIGNRITRQDMVVMLYRALNMKKEMTENGAFCSFEDYDTISDYAKNAVAFAEANEIVNGMGDGNFHPQNSATRAEAAVILYRAIEYLSNNM